MARNKKNQPKIDLTDPANYPDGRIKNDTGNGNGTPVNEYIYGDIHEFFAELMRLSGMTYSGLPDNVENGYQLIDALRAFPSKNAIVRPLTRYNNVLSVPFKLGKLLHGEFLVMKAETNRYQTNIVRGSDSVQRQISLKSSDDFSSGDYVIMFYENTPGSIVSIKKLFGSEIIGGLRNLRPCINHTAPSYFGAVQSVTVNRSGSNPDASNYVINLKENLPNVNYIVECELAVDGDDQLTENDDGSPVMEMNSNITPAYMLSIVKPRAFGYVKSINQIYVMIDGDVASNPKWHLRFKLTRKFQ